ncbi:MAG: hypothetical protein ACE5Q6_13020, partial [Dehalococcoidia bacterium]
MRRFAQHDLYQFGRDAPLALTASNLTKNPIDLGNLRIGEANSAWISQISSTVNLGALTERRD